MLTIRACATGDRRIARCSIPLSWMSSTYLPMPRMNRGSSLRSIRPWPTGCWSLFACSRSSGPAATRPSSRVVMTRSRRSRAGRRGLVGRSPLDRPDDRGVAGAAADLSGDGLADGVLARVGIAVQQGARGHQHPGRAEAALQAVAAHEALLHRVEDAVLLEALDGADLVAAGHRGQHRAGLHRLAVQPGHAGAAVAGVAPPVGPGEPELVAQEVDQQHPALDLPRHGLPVDAHGHLHVSRSFPGRPHCRLRGPLRSVPPRAAACVS